MLDSVAAELAPAADRSDGVSRCQISQFGMLLQFSGSTPVGTAIIIQRICMVGFHTVLLWVSSKPVKGSTCPSFPRACCRAIWRRQKRASTTCRSCNHARHSGRVQQPCTSFSVSVVHPYLAFHFVDQPSGAGQIFNHQLQIDNVQCPLSSKSILCARACGLTAAFQNSIFRCSQFLPQHHRLVDLAVVVLFQSLGFHFHCL